VGQKDELISPKACLAVPVWFSNLLLTGMAGMPGSSRLFETGGGLFVGTDKDAGPFLSLWLSRTCSMTWAARPAFRPAIRLIEEDGS
jgi:hypothetical protein